MQAQEHVELQLALCVDQYRRCKKELFKTVELRSSYVEDPGSCPPPSNERIQEIFFKEDGLREKMNVLAFTVKLLRWVLQENGPTALEIFEP